MTALLVDRRKLIVALSAAYPEIGQIRKVVDALGIARSRLVTEVSAEESWRALVMSATPAERERLVLHGMRDDAKVTSLALFQAAHESKRQAFEVDISGDTYLRCGRQGVWDELESRIKDPSHHTLLLCGTEDDGHNYFIDRTRVFRGELAAEVVRLDKRVFDDERGEALDFIRDALADPQLALPQLAGWDDEGADALVEAIVRITTVSNLILVYPEASMPKNAEWLERHHSIHLPRVSRAAYERDPGPMDAGVPRHGLIALQPIVWEPRIWDFIPRLSSHRVTHDRLSCLVSQEGTTCEARWADLGPLTCEDVERFFREVYEGDSHAIQSGIQRGLALLSSKPQPRLFFAGLREILQGGRGSPR